ncbi:Glypican-1 [Trichoplax sp. H2]|nr:Glypican-1 [Trichoplax sp. H2]|eukprot:RDD37539.1 Glypican-1 [Trichoplax sp. H2]
MAMNQHRLLCLCLLLSCSMYFMVATVEARDQQCYNVANHFRSKQLPINSHSLNPIPGTSLQHCTCKWTCCTRQSEKLLHDRVLTELASIGPNETNIMNHDLSTFITEFQGHISKNIDDAEKFMNYVYGVAYPDVYPMNKDIFTQFYSSLRHFMNGNLNNLENPLKELYTELVVRGFSYKSIKFDFNPKVRNCVKQLITTNAKMPGYPDKVIEKTKRVMDKTRGVLALLIQLRKQIPALSQMKAGQSCDRAVVNMHVCSICAAFSVPPCNKYCQHVLADCYYDQVYITKIFHDLSINLKLLIEQISSHYNMKEALGELTKDISIFVSAFDASPSSITDPITKNCKSLQNKRERRSADNDFVVDGISKDQVHLRSKKAANNMLASAGIKNNRNDKAYEKFLQNLSNVLESGQFSWEKVIDRACLSHFSAKTTTQCWNGTGVGSFSVSPNFVWNNQISVESTYIADRLIKLMDTTIKGIQNKPVEYPQLEIYKTPASSGFSGSGNPTDNDDTSEDDDDGNDGNVSGNASGGFSGSSANPEVKGNTGGTEASTTDNTPTIIFKPLTVATRYIKTTTPPKTELTTTANKPSTSATTEAKTTQSTTKTTTKTVTTKSITSSDTTRKGTVGNQNLQEDPTTTSSAKAHRSYSTASTLLISGLAYALLHTNVLSSL